MEMRKICFVCNGNNSRSILAEYIARNLWKDRMEVCSCGIQANETAEVGQNTQMVLKEIGIEIAGRKRQKMGEAFMGEGYFYFALDNRVKETLISDYGINEDRVKILDSRIMDPKGCSPEVYRECRDVIEQVIKAIELETFKSQVLPAPKEYWDSVSETKQFTTPFQAEIFSQYVNNDAQVLDVGCGYGRTLNELYHMGFRKLTGIDFSKGMIERGKRQFPYLDLLVKEEDRIEFPDNHFDAVILFAVLTCIPSDEEQRKLLEEIRRVLKPGGILYINDFLLNQDERNVSRYERFAKKYGTYGVFELSEGAVLRHHAEEYIKKLTADFALKEFQQVAFTTMNGHVSKGFFYIGAKEA